MTRARTDGPGTWQVPDVAALRDVAPVRPRWGGGLLHPRRVRAALLAFPLLLWGFRTSLPARVEPSTGWWALLGVVAILAALTLASYVPLPGGTRGGARGGASPCAAAAVVFVVLAAVALGGAGAPVVSGIPALALAAMGLGQRLSGSAACAPRAR